MLEAYGSAAQKQPDDVALLGQTEGYVEYNAQGRVIKGQVLPVSWLRVALGSGLYVWRARGRTICSGPLMQTTFVLVVGCCLGGSTAACLVIGGTGDACRGSAAGCRHAATWQYTAQRMPTERSQAMTSCAPELLQADWSFHRRLHQSGTARHPHDGSTAHEQPSGW